MKVVKQILRRQGVTNERELNPGDRITVCASGYMDLIIEKVGTDRISVAHYYTQQGDLISDPEVVFRIDGEEWIPVSFTQHPNIRQHDEDGLLEIDAFLRTWGQNLKRQGFVDEAMRTV